MQILRTDARFGGFLSDSNVNRVVLGDLYGYRFKRHLSCLRRPRPDVKRCKETVKRFQQPDFLHRFFGAPQDLEDPARPHAFYPAVRGRLGQWWT